MIASSLVCHPGAILEIGSGSGFNYGISLEASQSVRIGKGCMFASMVRICDSAGPTKVAPVVIGDEVWVAHGAIIEPGVTVGSGSVIAAGAVVTGEVPPGMLAIGNPARCMRLEMAGRQTG
jgi:maltose O-acetyltransferase